VDNLLHAAFMDTTQAPLSRTWQLPVLSLSLEQVLQALERRYGRQARQLVSHQGDAAIETLFGRCPHLHAPAALAAGFRHDENADQLISAALAPENSV
jgi:hypothetical protein